MADQQTGHAAVSGLVVTYYEKVGLERLLPKLRFYNFADKKPLPPRSGKTVYPLNCAVFKFGLNILERLKQTPWQPEAS